jgi:lipopolysaccharide biosynthesis glycosyltransferase
VHVACAVEGAYLAHSAAMLHSVATHAPGVHVHLLHGPAVPAEPVGEMLGALGARFTAHPISPERVDGLPVVEQFTAAMWFRVFLPELVPDADRVLYLDVDTIVVDSLEPLASIDLSGAYVGAVTNVLLDHHAGRPSSLGLAPGAYFNSGVLLMNLDAMRRDGCTEALLDYARSRGPELEWPDQDTLNAVLGERRVALHPRWNYMNSMRVGPEAARVFSQEELAEAARAPAIRHFEGPAHNKPWHWTAIREDHLLYRRHRNETPWPPRRGSAAASRALRAAAYWKRRLVRRG